jgi:hypothetical protein
MTEELTNVENLPNNVYDFKMLKGAELDTQTERAAKFKIGRKAIWLPKTTVRLDKIGCVWVSKWMISHSEELRNIMDLEYNERLK